MHISLGKLEDVADHLGGELQNLGRKVDTALDKIIPVLEKARETIALTPIAPWAHYLDLALDAMRLVERWTPDVVVASGDASVLTGQAKRLIVETVVNQFAAAAGKPLESPAIATTLIEHLHEAAQWVASEGK